jgi:maltooligosyltrehalose trehalohydrolase
MSWQASLGATCLGWGTRFRVWAPEAETVEVVLESQNQAHSMSKTGDGYFALVLPSVGAGTLYRYRVDGKGPFPDPASRFQPDGVHGPSQIVDPGQFEWSDQQWSGIEMTDLVLYELHIGTFTPEGTFAAAAKRLAWLKDLGVTAVELMPVSDFPGERNWGYDGVCPFAPARCYGTPDDLRALVSEAHRLGLAVHLDVVYNHFGPDGAYQGTFSGAYFSKKHHSPWGAALNFDGPLSEPVRDYVIENALRWIHEYHFDGLRLDATHAIADDSHRHILASIASAVRASVAQCGRRVQVVAEDVRNLAGMVTPEAEGGWGLDGVWSDDFHHQVRRCLAGDSDGYFQDFDGATSGIAATARQGWFYTGQHAPYFNAARGTDPNGVPLERFVFFIQNHDQVGNRAFGDRLNRTIEPAAYRAASVLLLMLPETPLLFMGQEWAASSPFRYFTDHHAELGRLVTEGRRKEFASFRAFADSEAREKIPDPQDVQTFLRSKLNWEECEREPHAAMLRLYRRLLRLRREEPALRSPAREDFVIEALDDDTLILQRRAGAAVPLLGVVCLRGAGAVSVAGHVLGEPAFTTEDAAFCPDPAPVEFDAGDGSIRFQRPGAVVLHGSFR